MPLLRQSLGLPKGPGRSCSSPARKAPCRAGTCPCHDAEVTDLQTVQTAERAASRAKLQGVDVAMAMCVFCPVLLVVAPRGRCSPDLARCQAAVARRSLKLDGFPNPCAASPSEARVLCLSGSREREGCGGLHSNVSKGTTPPLKSGRRRKTRRRFRTPRRGHEPQKRLKPQKRLLIGQRTRSPSFADAPGCAPACTRDPSGG